MRAFLAGLALVWLVTTERVAAQPTTEPTPETETLEPPASPTDAEAPAQSEPAAPPADRPCQPACRLGRKCYAGRCVSACNPACSAGQHCLSSGACITAAGASPPPTPIKAPERAPRLPTIFTD